MNKSKNIFKAITSNINKYRNEKDIYQDKLSQHIIKEFGRMKKAKGY